MSKLVKYFNNQAEYDAYWQGEQPGSKYLCIIQDSGVEGLENVLVTTSNNAPNSGGEQQEMGGSTIDIISEQAETISEQLEEIAYQQEVIADYENDYTVSKKEYNTLVDEIDEATDITYDISGEEKPLEDGWYVVGDTGTLYPFNYVQQADEWQIECGGNYFTDFPCYFMYIDNKYGDEIPYYTTDTFDWTELSDTPIWNNNKYENERITCENTSVRGYMSINDGKETWLLTTNLM